MKNLKHMEWNNNLSIGNNNIDHDHKKLIGIYNDLVKLVESGGARDDFARILSEMTDYCLQHFEKEEAYMEELKYPYYQEHKQKHEEYSYAVAMFNADLLGDNPPDPIKIMSYIKNWWTTHILNQDISYEKFRREKKTDARYSSF